MGKSWLTEKHFQQLEEFNDNLHFNITKMNAETLRDVLIPVVLPLDEALMLAIHRDGRPRKVIANDMEINQSTIVHVIKRHHQQKFSVMKRILTYCARFNVKVLLVNS